MLCVTLNSTLTWVNGKANLHIDPKNLILIKIYENKTKKLEIN